MQPPSTQKRKFVPASLDLSNSATAFDKLLPLYDSLHFRDIRSKHDLQQWLLDFSELTAVVDEHGARLYIAKTCHTDDKAIEARFMNFVELVEPRIKPHFFRLQKQFLECPHRAALEASDPKYVNLTKKWRADVELFREENVPLETEVTKTVSEYDKISGAQSVQIDGKEFTLPQTSRFLEETDRALRERAWRAVAERRLQDRAKLDDIFDTLLPLREKIATNAGKKNYRDYMWTALKRFDYTPADCEAFHDAVEKTVVPLIRKLDQDKAKTLGLAVLRPWDTEVDVLGREPLRPFDQAKIDDFVQKTWQIFDRMSPALAADFHSLRVNDNLDLESRKGKAPGGYQSTLEEVGQPFIFMNAAGMQRDVETLLHEGGHAFHALASASEELVFLRSAPMEFCEVASMSMELLACDHFDVFYSEPSAASRAKRFQLEGNIRILAWIATVDAFQHWIYTHPGHTRPQRTAKWLEIRQRFTGAVDWTGLDAEHEAFWHRQLHLFHLPFYYIEYGIAQLGSLQLWLRSQEDRHTALSNYRHALRLGGTKPLPDLFTAAGLHFDFSEKTVRPLVSAVEEELAKLPA